MLIPPPSVASAKTSSNVPMAVSNVISLQAYPSMVLLGSSNERWCVTSTDPDKLMENLGLPTLREASPGQNNCTETQILPTLYYL